MTREEQEKIIYENIPKVYEAGAVSIKNEVAGALEGFASGEAVALRDVSKVEHDLGVRVSSENLFNPKNPQLSTTTHRGITFEPQNNSSIHVYGTNDGSGRSYYAMYITIPKGIYNLSGIPTGGSKSTYYVEFYGTESKKNYGYDFGNGVVAELKEQERCNFELSVGVGMTVDFTVYPMLVKGTIKPPIYIPCIPDISAVKLRVQGGNLLDVDNEKLISSKLNNVVEKEHIPSGIKITSAVTTSDTLSAGFRIGSIAEMIGKTYTISFDKFASGVSDTPKGMVIIVYKDDDRSQSYIEQGYVGNSSYCARIASNAEQNSLTFTIPTDVNFDFYNVGVLFDFNRGREVEAGTVVEYKGVSLVPGTVAATEYEPYVEPIEYSVNADGTVEGVKSLYPSTTLTTDTVGALIEVDYNRDINKAFEEIRKVILSLGGTL